MYKWIGVKEEDWKRLKDISDRKGLKLYETVSMLIKCYERLEMLQHYLGCESIEDLFREIEEMLPKSKKQLIIAKTNRYLDELSNLGIPMELRDKLSMAIFKVLNGEVR